MQKAKLVSMSLAIWLAVFYFFQFAGYWMWEMSPASIGGNLGVGFFSSAIGIATFAALTEGKRAKAMSERHLTLVVGILAVPLHFGLALAAPLEAELTQLTAVFVGAALPFLFFGLSRKT